MTSRLHDKELIVINSPTSFSEGFLFLSCFHGLNNVTAFFLLIFLNTSHLFFPVLHWSHFPAFYFPVLGVLWKTQLCIQSNGSTHLKGFLWKRRESFEFIYLNGLSFSSAIYLCYEIVFSVHDLINIACFLEPGGCSFIFLDAKL